MDSLIQTDWKADLYGVSSPSSDSFGNAIKGHLAHSDYGSSPPLKLGNPDVDTSNNDEYGPVDADLLLPVHNIQKFRVNVL